MTFRELLTLVQNVGPFRVCTDSRHVKKGDIFVAVKGTAFDGHDFIQNALNKGAYYIVCERKPKKISKTNIILVKNSAKAAAVLAQTARGNPASKMINLAVTGTNGKTTIAFLVQSIIKTARRRCGLIGTVIYDTGKKVFPSTLTTPDCVDIARMTDQMVKAGSKYMIAEASSHALSQDRLAAIDFKAAAFTNLTGDHMDYHKTPEDYLAAKTKLFKKLSADATAVLNKQSPHARQIARQTNANILWYAVDQPADIIAHIHSTTIKGSVFSIEYAGKKIRVKTDLVGTHNVSNCLAAAGLCLAAGFDLKDVAIGLEKAKQIPGRLEKINWPGNFTVFVDYAHTDDALKNVLSALRPLCKGKLILLFGCGGDRDRTKRPRMAKVAEQLADYIIITSDNPRTEEPAAIIGEIVTGFKNPVADTIHPELDREEAIAFAVKNAKKADILLIAGKGHETYQIIGKRKKEFSDKKIALKYLRKLK